MTSLIKLATISSVLVAGLVFTADADAGSCTFRRCVPRRYVPSRRPLPPPVFPGPGLGRPGGLPPAGAPGLGGPGVGGQGVGGQGVGAQGVGAQGVGAQGVGAQGAGGQGAGAQVGRAQSQAVSVPVGATITLPGNRGVEMGQVNLVLSGVRLPLTVLDWNENGITVTLPGMQITTSTQAQLEIKLPGSNTAETLSIQLQPQPTVLIQDAPVIVSPPAPVQADEPAVPEAV